MSDMTKPDPTTTHTVPPRIDADGWREKIPPRIMAEAEKLGPLPLSPTHDETPEQARERKRLQAEARAARWSATLPVMYRDASLEDLDPATITALSPFLDGEGTTLVLAGQVGVGKTHTGYAVGHYLAADGVWVEAWTLADLLAAMRPDGDPRAGKLARDCDVLLLDDFGAVKASEWAVEQITALLDARLREHKRQVVTTNAPYEALAEAWGHRAMDRLRYRWTVVTMTGESRRKAAW